MNSEFEKPKKNSTPKYAFFLNQKKYVILILTQR